MSRVDLQSTVLQTAAYHSQLALLELEFRSGAIYHYFGVPAQTYQELLLAESKGGYFNHASATASPIPRSNFQR